MKGEGTKSKEDMSLGIFTFQVRSTFSWGLRKKNERKKGRGKD